MPNATNSQRGQAGPAGSAAATAEDSAAHKSGSEAMNGNRTAEASVLSSDGMIASLLGNEFKDLKLSGPEERPGDEVQPGGETEQDSQGQEPGDGSQESGEQSDGEQAKGDGAGEDAGDGGEAGEGTEGEGEQGGEGEGEAQDGEEAQGQFGELGKKFKLPQEVVEVLNEMGAGKSVREVAERIGTITFEREEAKRKLQDAEKRVQRLTQQVEQAQQKQQPARASRLDEMDEKSIEQLEASANQLRDAGLNFLDNVATDQERQLVERYMQSERLDEAGLKRRLREVGSMLDRQIPARRTTLAQFRELEAQAAPMVKKFFPFLLQKDSQEYQDAQNVLNLFPELKSRTPNWQLAIGVYALGLKAFNKLMADDQAKSKAGTPGGRALPSKAPTKTVTAPRSAPPRTPTGQQTQDAVVRQRFSQAPNRENAVELAKQGLRNFKI